MDSINWEPQSVANLAENLSKIANEYRTIISEIYSNYNSIGVNSLWTGENYNTIANDIFNTSRSTFIEWADYIQYKIPELLYEIAKTQSKNGIIEFFLYEASDEIKAIENTQEKNDGSFVLQMTEAQKIVNSYLNELCNEANKKLQIYLTQFEELKSMDENAAVYVIHEKLEGIIDRNKSVLKSFITEIEMAVEKTFNNIRYTNEETIRMAERITNIIDNP